MFVHLQISMVTFATVDLRSYWEVLHVNMVKIRGCRIKSLPRWSRSRPCRRVLEGPTVPIRYVMPRGEKIELWIQESAIQTEPGDTARTVAQRYSVPVWAVAQLNNVDANTSFQQGKRLVVPRYLETAPVAAGPLTSYASPAAPLNLAYAPLSFVSLRQKSVMRRGSRPECLNSSTTSRKRDDEQEQDRIPKRALQGTWIKGRVVCFLVNSGLWPEQGHPCGVVPIAASEV